MRVSCALFCLLAAMVIAPAARAKTPSGQSYKKYIGKPTVQKASFLRWWLSTSRRAKSVRKTTVKLRNPTHRTAIRKHKPALPAKVVKSRAGAAQRRARGLRGLPAQNWPRGVPRTTGSTLRHVTRLGTSTTGSRSALRPRPSQSPRRGGISGQRWAVRDSSDQLRKRPGFSSRLAGRQQLARRSAVPPLRRVSALPVNGGVPAPSQLQTLGAQLELSFMSR